jgi:uncharacterized protein (DUF1501 family)
MPQFVSLRGLTQGLEPGYLGVGHRAYAPDGPGAANLRLPAGVDIARLRNRRALLKQFDQVRRDLETSGVMASMDALTERAFAMVTSEAVLRALDLSREGQSTRERYGAKAEHLLLARRLVEAGVGCVTAGIGTAAIGASAAWDTHEDNFEALRTLLPKFDQGLSALVEDLHERGLADDVVVLACGEFGRTPRINVSAGRDHWPQVMSCLLAGGELKTGQVIGSTNARGEEALDRPYSIQRVLATVYHALGIDAGRTFPDRTGRPVALLEDREPIKELL